MKKAYIACLLAAILTAASLFSCAGSAGDSTGGSETAPDETTLAETEPDPALAAFFSAARAYILTGEYVNWSEAFLDEVDFPASYDRYINEGGASEDVGAFAVWLTDNADVPDNWQELFEAALLEAYEVIPNSYDDLGNGLYTVYVTIDGESVPYVTVNSRTGWYHG